MQRQITITSKKVCSARLEPPRFLMGFCPVDYSLVYWTNKKKEVSILPHLPPQNRKSIGWLTVLQFLQNIQSNHVVYWHWPSGAYSTWPFPEYLKTNATEKGTGKETGVGWCPCQPNLSLLFWMLTLVLPQVFASAKLQETNIPVS